MDPILTRLIDWSGPGALLILVLREVLPHILPALARERERKVKLEERRMAVTERQIEVMAKMDGKLTEIQKDGEIVRNGMVQLLERVPDHRRLLPKDPVSP